MSELNDYNYTGNNIYGDQSGNTGNVEPEKNEIVVKKQKKSNGMAKKVFATIGLAIIFGVVASATFQFSNKITEKLGFSKEIGSVEASVDESYEAETEKAAVDDFIKEESEEIENDTITDTVPIEEVRPLSLAGTDTGLSVVQVASEAMPSIVAITNKSVQEVMSMYGLGIQQYEAESAGSGIIIGQNDTELLIATNAHVVKDADTLTVCFIDEEAYEAQIKGADSENDIAVIAVSLNNISGSTLEAIKIAKIGDSKALQIGEQVVAIGNALGYGQSVTTGIVSALDRSIDGSGEGTSYIQTDAAINPGNSGGALLNMSGELVGINSAKLANTKIEGMGYAIPISVANPIMDDLMNMVTRSQVDASEAGYLGITGFSVTNEVAGAYNIPKGIYISETTPGCSADKAGIKKGDVIIKFDGMSMDSITKLKDRLLYYRAGESVDVLIARADNGEYKEKTIKVVLDKRDNVMGDSGNSTKEQSDALEDDGESQDDMGPNSGGQRNGSFQFGGNQFEYSFPDNIFDIFGFN